MANQNDGRPDPDALLANAQRSERGHLKIFLGAAPGVGKTWEMLTAAHAKRQKGVDVVAGLIETHGRAGTIEVIGELEQLPRLNVPYRGQTLAEFDLDAALLRRPALLLVDELAHTNAPGLRHAKRWQDVLDVLDAGIDVWTTVNVQHLESLNDQITRITGVRVGETVPDTVLDIADEIELIDLPPAELRARLQEGFVYRPDVAARALEGFFREGNLGALREIALRRAAQRIDKDVTRYMRSSAIPGPWPVAEKVLALIGPDDAASNVVRHAARLAEALRAPLTSFYIERTDDNSKVQAALDLTVQLGGNVVTQSAPDMVRAVMDYAAAQNITHIVVGRAARGRWPRRRFSEALTRQALAYTLHFVPVPAAAPQRPDPLPQGNWTTYLWAAALLAAITFSGSALKDILPQEAMGLIFTGLIAAMASREGRGPGLFTAIVGFFLWNFFFLPPLYTFSVADPRDVVALAVFLLVGIVTGTLAGRVRKEAATASARVEALRRISLFGQRLSRAVTLSDILNTAIEETTAITGAGIVLLAHNGALTPEASRPAGTELDETAEAAAEWCLTHDMETGTGTATLPSVPWRFFPLRGHGTVVGVLGARADTPPPAPTVQTLVTLADQTALALERARLALQTARTEAHQDSQKLRNALLSSLSHDLRTPLTAIRGAAETLAASGEVLSEATRADLLAAIIQDAARMGKFLANIIDMARVEAGALDIKHERLSLEAIAEAAIARVPGALYTALNVARDATHVRADPTLLEQVLVNLLDNAVKYAPPGSRISISTQREGSNVRLSVADEGVGIVPTELQAVFDSFFRASRGDRVAPGTGLGLAIAKAFTEAMDGRISAQSPRLDLPADGLPGTVITLELPAA
ncbi:sensor histidine kinase [Acidocella aminolytica]|uniref:histidine kinase n=1 Tax=Acidocella aminolytica 101 = DSM 11237 TaxID=1120923 RepID=A0A0D6PI32_9PROT|nr:sensor histidine kinase KdpD [Acidocella aminolytica]GAN81036.1 two component transcriptional regulator osmosensitive K+ channel signal transduction histidine kinase [Acidocella aminolytica 101 = DSM 11237]GBQ42735.1 osmosensitive K+ channel histidine kinase [Acidocella aminolytica 101 = DSM 11237]SHF18926.1 two-component system, OmpR family, sensor histidine kinase KdpD [Acidocella aminolytica 101 = DSM 11237]